jgi:hypothetical protein
MFSWSIFQKTDHFGILDLPCTQVSMLKHGILERGIIFKDDYLWAAEKMKGGA